MQRRAYKTRVKGDLMKLYILQIKLEPDSGFEFWFLNEMCHREAGLSIIYAKGILSCFLHDKKNYKANYYLDIIKRILRVGFTAKIDLELLFLMVYIFGILVVEVIPRISIT